MMNPCESSSSRTSDYHAMILEETKALFDSDWKQQRKKSTTVANRRISRPISGMDIEVFKAARKGDIDALGERSDRLHRILTPTGNTVLHVYVACVGSAKLTKSSTEMLKSAEIVEEILKLRRQLLSQPNESGDTALHLAARYGCADIVGVLIKAAKEFHGDLEEGTSSTEGCCQLLIRGINEEKNTALHEAVRFDHLDVVKMLINEDPEFLYRTNDVGETPLYIAAERGYGHLVSEMLAICTNPSYQGPDGFTALHIAVAYGDEQMTRKLLEKEMTLAIAAAGDGATPLHIAASKGHVSIVKQILERDKSCAYISDNFKRTPVHYAAMVGHIDVLKQIMLYCPDSFELVDRKGRNALHWAVISNEDKVEEFVRNDSWLSSVLLNGKNFVGITPLHEIAASEKYNGLAFIRDSRVDKMAFNKENKNALDFIRRSSDSEWKSNLEQGLRQSGARKGQRLLKQTNGGNKTNVHQGDYASGYKEFKDSHMVVSALIATVTFAAGFTVPGGYQSERGPDQGFAVLSRNAAFKTFVITNTLALILSISAMMLRSFLSLKGSSATLTVPLNCTSFAEMAMLVAFLSGTYAILGSHSSLGLAITTCVLGGVLYPVIGFVSVSPVFRTFRQRALRFTIRTVKRLGLEYYCLY